MTDQFIRRTYEPFKFLGRLTLIPLPIARGTRWITLTQTVEPEPPYRWAPTLVVKAGPFPFGIGIGWWLDTQVENLKKEFSERSVMEEVQAEYDRYQAVNGEIDFEDWVTAREAVLAHGGDPEDALEITMALEHQG